MISQLRSLLQLTQAESAVARIRVAQARTDAVRRELTENAENAERRTHALTAELRRLGGVADAVSPVVGRVGAVAKAAVEQAEPMDEALLGDLALEHQLLDRARYLRALAEAGHDRSVGALADRLIAAHEATVEWLTVVLAESALGGPVALRATPLQLTVGGVARAVHYPVRFARERLDRLVASVSSSGAVLADRAQDVVGRAARLGDDARDVVSTGRDAALDRAEDLARREGAADTASALHDTRTRLGALHGSELPIGNYDALGVDDAVTEIKKLQTTDDLTTVLHHEEATKNRRGVVSAIQTRFAALAKDVVGARD